MIQISPKLIDIDENRIEFKNEVDKRVGTNISNGIKTKSVFMQSDMDCIVPMFKIGRYPTQLFTNIKKDRYKYVRNIT